MNSEIIAVTQTWKLNFKLSGKKVIPAVSFMHTFDVSALGIVQSESASRIGGTQVSTAATF